MKLLCLFQNRTLDFFNYSTDVVKDTDSYDFFIFQVPVLLPGPGNL